MTKICFTCKDTSNPYEIHKTNLLKTDDWKILQEKTPYFSNGLNIDKTKIKIKNPVGSSQKLVKMVMLYYM
jgi:hypothetical protein